MNPESVAQLIERFLQKRSLYPQEWNDFVDTPQWDKKVDSYRKRCFELDPLVNLPGPPDPKTIAELKSLIEVLRSHKT